MLFFDRSDVSKGNCCLRFGPFLLVLGSSLKLVMKAINNNGDGK